MIGRFLLFVFLLLGFSCSPEPIPEEDKEEPEIIIDQGDYNPVDHTIYI